MRVHAFFRCGMAGLALRPIVAWWACCILSARWPVRRPCAPFWGGHCFSRFGSTAVSLSLWQVTPMAQIGSSPILWGIRAKAQLTPRAPALEVGHEASPSAGYMSNLPATQQVSLAAVQGARILPPKIEGFAGVGYRQRRAQPCVETLHGSQGTCPRCCVQQVAHGLAQQHPPCTEHSAHILGLGWAQPKRHNAYGLSTASIGGRRGSLPRV